MKKRIKEKLWTESFVKICVVNFFIFVNFHALLPTFPYYIEYLGGDSVAIGLATALFSMASIVSRPFLGWLVDTKGRCTLLVIGLIGMSLLSMGYFVAAGIAFAVSLRTVHGAFHAASSNSASTWVTDIIPCSRMGEGLGMFGLSMAISTAVAPALGLTVMNCVGGEVSAFGFRALFIMTAVSALLALFIGASIKNRSYSLSKESIRLNALFEMRSLPASITQFFFMIAYGVVEVYVAIYATKNGLLSGGVYFIFIAVATVLTRVVLGKAIDRYGEGIMVYTGNAAIIVGIMLLVLAHNIPCYILSALLLGYSFGAIQPSLQTMAMHVVTPDRRGAASSTFFCAFDMGIALGGFIAGILVKFMGYDRMFLSIAFAAVLSLAYYYLFGRNHESSLNPLRREASESSVEMKSEFATSAMGALPLVVTISREYGSGGHSIGKYLAESLGVKLYDGELIEMTAKESGLSEDFVQANEQKLQDCKLFDLYVDFLGAASSASSVDPAQTAMFYAQCKIIRDLAAKESCVIVGRLANFILRGRPHALHVFVHADPAYRVSRIMDRNHVNRSHAEQELYRVDESRKEHCLHFTGKEWGACRYYDLSFNSAWLGIKGTAELIYSLLKYVKKDKS